MQEILRIQKKIVPELVEVLEKRYNILGMIYYSQPVGRRVLANELTLSERAVRTEINFLKAQGLIEIDTPGMTITKSGEEVVNKLKGFIHEIKGLSELEDSVKDLLHLNKVIIVPGDVDENHTVLKELGKACSKYVKSIMHSNSIVALTGGSTLKEVIDAFPHTNNFTDVLVVPARGGMGKNVETQANTLAASFAKKINGAYKMLHIPENLSSDISDSLLKEKEIREVIECIHKADILIYGVGNASRMAKKRGVAKEEVERLLSLGAIGEAFGCYFDKNSKVVYHTSPIGISITDARNIKRNIAVAGGKNKVESIITTQRNNTNGILVTDEAAGREIVKILQKNS